MLAQALPAVPAFCATPHGRLAAAAPGRPTARRRSGGGSSGGGVSLRPPRAQLQQPDGDLPDLQPPKFQPFAPRNALQQAMVRFRHRTDLGGGDALLVAPLHADWVPDAAELLASSFADSLAASLYKRYLQRQIKAYLEAHINLPPKAVVLAALHMPRELAEAAEAEARALAEAAQSAAAAGTLAAWPSSSAGNMSSSVENGLPSSSGSTTTTTSISSSSSSSNSSGVQLGGLDSALSSCDVDVEATAAALQLYGNSNGMLGSSGSSSEAAATVAGSIPAPATALATVGSGSLLAPGSGAVLTSVLELSFSPSTRSKHLTLQSPDSRPYLCNMAVAEVHRRRGYGLALLTAAEALVRSLGENEIYLHTRVQDTPAQLLYAKAGYEQVAADSFLVKLIGLDQRRLLRKRLQR